MHLEKGIATRDDIDTTLKLGMAHPMGPLQLADLCVPHVLDVAYRTHVYPALALILALQFSKRSMRVPVIANTARQFCLNEWSMQAGTGRRTGRASMNTQHDDTNVQCMRVLNNDEYKDCGDSQN